MPDTILEKQTKLEAVHIFTGVVTYHHFFKIFLNFQFTINNKNLERSANNFKESNLIKIVFSDKLQYSDLKDQDSLVI